VSKSELPGKGNSNSRGARPVHLIITMIKWIRTRRLTWVSKSEPPPSLGVRSCGGCDSACSEEGVVSYERGTPVAPTRSAAHQNHTMSHTPAGETILTHSHSLSLAHTHTVSLTHTRRGSFLRGCCPAPHPPRETISIQLMTPDRKLKARNEGSTGTNLLHLLLQPTELLRL